MRRLDLSPVSPTRALLHDQAALAVASDVQGPEVVRRRGSGGYRSLSHQLWMLQEDKCGYCESFLEERADEVDHIRPKAASMYWWLAFSAPNLVMACRSCNNFKGNQFELQTGSRKLVPREEPWTLSEPAMLVDPTVEDPALHLTFVLRGGEWRIAGLTDRGVRTIAMLRLDRASLTKRTNRFISDAIDPLAAQLGAARRSGDKTAIRNSIAQLAALRSTDRQWTQLIHCVLDEIRAGRYPPT